MLTTLLLATLLPSAPAPVALAADDLFRAAAEELVLAAPDGKATPLTMMELLDRYAAVTGQRGSWSDDTRRLLENQRATLSDAVSIPAGDVQRMVESILRSSGYAISPDGTDAVPVFHVDSLQGIGRGTLRERAIYLEAEEAEAVAARHPAVIFTTVVRMPHTDVRQLTNTLRTMITDANVQQMLPAGTSNSIVLVGFGGTIVRMKALLGVIEDASRRNAERRRIEVEAIRLEHRDPAELADVLLVAFGSMAAAAGDPSPRGKMGVVADGPSRSLLVRGTREQRHTVKDLVALLDVPAGK